MHRKIVYLHHIAFLCVIFAMMHQYTAFIKSYREQHPSYQSEQLTYETVKKGLITEISISKRTCILISDENNHILLSSLSDNDLLKILNGSLVAAITYENDKSLWMSQKNNGIFDYDRYLYSEGITDKGDIINIDFYDQIPARLTQKLIWPFVKIKMFLIKKTYYLESNVIKDMLLALFFKEKQLLSSYEQYKLLGIAHLFTISGLHFGILYLFIKKFFILGTIKFRKFMTIIIMVLLYLILDSGIASLRALLMIIYLESASIIKRKPDKLVMITVVNLLILEIDPNAVLGTSYFLSFYAYTAIAYVLPLMVKNKTDKKAITVVKNYFILQIMLLPITVVSFHYFNLWGFIVNLIFIPVFSIFVPASLFFLILNSVLSNITVLISPIFEKLISLLNLLLSVMPLHIIDMPLFKVGDLWLIMSVFLVATFCQATVSLRLKTNTASILIASILLISALTIEILKTHTDDLTITFIDVKHGDAALISYRDKNILIDTGSEYADVSDILLAKGIHKLDYVILSHAHEDHFGGYYAINENLSINQLICLSDVKNVLESNGVQNVKYISTGDISVGDLILSVQSHLDHDDINNQGVWVMLKYHDFTAAFLGDYSKETLREITLPNHIDLLKVPHHGSATGLDAAFFTSHDIENAVISHNQKYQMPDVTVYRMLKEKTLHTYSTFENGNLIWQISENDEKVYDYYYYLTHSFINF